MLGRRRVRHWSPPAAAAGDEGFENFLLFFWLEDETAERSVEEWALGLPVAGLSTRVIIESFSGGFFIFLFFIFVFYKIYFCFQNL